MVAKGGESVGDSVPMSVGESASLADLNPINSDTVLTCLHERFAHSIVYTRGGSVLIAVNPFKQVENLYSSNTIEAYAQKEKKLPPHIYDVGGMVLDQMVREVGKINQTIIVSGESGAGKTVSSRHLLKYLTMVSGSESKRTFLTGSDIEKKILNSSPILEAFGNATTPINENSSRFGKFIQLQFDRSGHMLGAKINTYLLEKTRVMHQSEKDCNFHIFYQLLEELMDKSSTGCLPLIHDDLKTTDHFRILPYSSERKCKQSSNLRQIVVAMEELGLVDQQQLAVFQILLAILFLGNIEFTEGVDDESAEVCRDKMGQTALVTASQCLGVDPDKLLQFLLHRSIKAGLRSKKSMFVKPVQVLEARSRKDSLAMLLYSRLFDWLVCFVNNQFKADKFSWTISLLDIYGFECFGSNSLEQLCINYANEKLQQHYIQQFLKNLQEEYKRECVPWVYTDFVDNQVCLDMLHGNPSIFGILNEEVYLNRQTDTRILGNRLLSVAHQANVSTKKQKVASCPSCVFVVNHYAGAVSYAVAGLVTKNKDNIPAEFVTLLQCSEKLFVKELFADFSLDEMPGKKKRTVLEKFKSSFEDLISLLKKSDVHYVRCIKPNPDSQAGVFDRTYVTEQLKACGIIETVLISKRGHPARFAYRDFLQRYRVILSGNLQTRTAPGDAEKENDSVSKFLDHHLQQQLGLPEVKKRMPTPQKILRRRTVSNGQVEDECQRDGLSSEHHMRKCCAAVIKEVCGLMSQEYLRSHFGKTKLFLNQQQFDQLEVARSGVLNQHAAKIQHSWRRCRKWKRKRKAAVRIQRAVRKWLQRKHQCMVELCPFDGDAPETEWKVFKECRCINIDVSHQNRHVPLHGKSRSPQDGCQGSGDGKPPPSKRLKKVGGLGELNCCDGLVSRRQLRKVPMKFHTRPSVLRNAHIVHNRELQCSLTDCLPDSV